MKILVADTVFPKGHKLLNNKLLSYLNDDEITVINSNGYYNKQLFPNYNFIDFEFDGENKISKTDRIREFVLNYRMTKSLKIKDFDKIIYFTFDTINFAFELPFLKSRNVYLFHHKNTSELSNKTYRIIFKTYANRVNHIVFSKSIADYLIDEIGVHKDLVHVLPHPILMEVLEINKKAQSNKKNINWIGLGYGNDEYLIDEILNFEDKYHFLSKNNIYLTLRWSKPEKHLDNIHVINGHMDIEDYKRLYNKSTGVLLLYPLNYTHRFSGALMDALACGKQVIGNDIPIVREFNSEYNSYCTAFTKVEDLLHLLKLKSLDTASLKSEDLIKFRKNHEDAQIKLKFRKILNGR